MLLSDQLKQARAAKAEEAQGIYTAADTAKRAPTAEEKTKFDGLMSEVEGLNGRIASQLVIEAALVDKPKTLAAPPVLDTENNKKALVQFPYSGKLKAYRKYEDTGRPAHENAYRAGKWMQAVLHGNKKAQQWCQENGVFAYGTNEVLFNVHEEGTNETGGFLVPDEFERAIIDLRIEYGVIRQWARTLPMMSDYKVQPKRTGTLTAYPRAESNAATESTKTWGNIALTAKSWDVFTRWSRELNEDSIISMTDDLTMEAGRAFAYAEDNAAFNGDGGATYNGIKGLITKFAESWAASETFKSGSTTATHDLYSEIDADDIDKVVASLPVWASINHAWYMSPICKALAFDPILRAAGGNTQDQVAAGAPPRYLGAPIVISPLLNNVTTTLDEQPMFFYGDMSQAIVIGDRRGITVQVLNELYAVQGQIGLIASERFDINVHSIGDTTTAGPIVAYFGETS